MFRDREEFFDGLGLSAFQSVAEFLEILDQHAEHAGEIGAISQRDVPPHFWRAGGDPRGIAKAAGAEQRLFFGMNRAQHVVGEFRGEHVRKVTRTGHLFVVNARSQQDGAGPE